MDYYEMITGANVEFAIQRTREFVSDGRVEFACFDAMVQHLVVLGDVGREPHFVWDSVEPIPGETPMDNGERGSTAVDVEAVMELEGLIYLFLDLFLNLMNISKYFPLGQKRNKLKKWFVV